MKALSKVVLGAALAFGALGAGLACAAQPATASASWSPAEREALFRLKSAFETGDMAAATTALVAAKSAASAADARFHVAQYQYQIGVRTGNFAMQAEGLEAMLASGRVPAQDVPALYSQLASISYNYVQDLERAERYIARQVETAPNDPGALANYARIKRDRKKHGEALPLLVRAIAAQRASGRAVPENWYKMAIDMAYAAKNGPQAAALGRELVAAYPSQQNWRDALLIYRDLQATDPATRLDTYRLLRASKALGGERDFYEAAAAFQAGGLPAEAKAVIQDGVSARMVDAAKGTAKDYLTKSNARITQEKAGLTGQQSRAAAAATGEAALKAADAHVAFGEYAKAAALYRTALEKGSVDANLVNSRLGMALALAGQRAEAEAALRAVTGPRADLAGYWLAWLARRA